MADFNSLERQIDTLARAMAEGFEDIHKKFEKVDQKLERIERTLDTQIQNHLDLETRVTKLEEPAAH